MRNALLGSAALAAGKLHAEEAKEAQASTTYDKLMDQVGFNHLPNKEEATAKTVLHRANTRGHANHGWLNTHHSFSFANYRNPDRMHFGVLRVLNDDWVAPGRGFGRHPHDNMEIISIPLDGSLEHQDSMGNKAVIKAGDIQVMSAGTGVYHSEYNQQKDQPVKFLQIWLFPNKRQVTPRYDQITLKPQQIDNQLYQILSPNPHDEGVWIHQNAWFHLGSLREGFKSSYSLKDSRNGVYVFLIEGKMEVAGQTLNPRDGMGIWDTDSVEFKANSQAKVLFMEVPMTLG